MLMSLGLMVNGRAGLVAPHSYSSTPSTVSYLIGVIPQDGFEGSPAAQSPTGKHSPSGQCDTTSGSPERQQHTPAPGGQDATHAPDPSEKKNDLYNILPFHQHVL